MVLPEGLNGTATLIFLACGGIVWALIQFGIIGGRKSAANPSAPGASEIVALTVDSRAIDKLAGEVSGLSIALTDLAVSNRQLGGHVETLTDELRDTNNELRVAREIAKYRQQ